MIKKRFSLLMILSLLLAILSACSRTKHATAEKLHIK